MKVKTNKFDGQIMSYDLYQLISLLLMRTCLIHSHTCLYLVPLVPAEDIVVQGASLLIVVLLLQINLVSDDIVVVKSPAVYKDLYRQEVDYMTIDSWC